MMAQAAEQMFVEGADPGHKNDRVECHAGVDRLFHWLPAAAVLTLMATRRPPVLGIKFNWVVVHWSVGILH